MSNRQHATCHITTMMCTNSIQHVHTYIMTQWCRCTLVCGVEAEKKKEPKIHHRPISSFSYCTIRLV